MNRYASTTTTSTLLLLLLLLYSSAASSSTLDPKQLTALQSLFVPTTHDPCTQPTTATCDSSAPFRHLLTLRLSNCTPDIALSTTALSSLSTLTSLSFLNCPVPIVHFPTSLSSNLRSFTSFASLQRLTGVFLSRFQNLSHLNISDDPIKASGVRIIVSSMRFLSTLTLSNTNLSGSIPKRLNSNLTHVDFSRNKLNGTIPTSLTLLGNLKVLNLSSNQLRGEIPVSFGDLISLQNVSLNSNSLSGSIPRSVSDISGLVHLDLGSNQFNGTIPGFLSEMKGLRYLNLEKNNFHGVMPFNASFIKRLVVFKIDGNDDLCYNHSTVSKKLKLGIAACDRHGMPILPPPAANESDDMSSGDYDDDGGDSGKKRNQDNGDHGPSKVVLGVAIGLSAVVFLIIFLVFLSKCGARCCGCCC